MKHSSTALTQPRQQTLPGITMWTRPHDRRPPARPAFVLPRADLIEWLERREALPVRVVAAPAGFGKSLLLQAYASERDTPYVHAIDLARPDGSLAPFDASSRREFVIDDVDALLPETVAALFALVRATPGASFVLGTRSRDVIDNPRCFVDGSADLLDAEALAFGVAEIAELCKHYRIKATDEQMRAFLRDSDGWPMIAHSAIGYGACERLPFAGLFDAWLAARGPVLLDAIESSARGEILDALIGGADSLTADQLRSLERAGHFVVRRGAEYRVLNALASLREQEPEEAAGASDATMTIQLLGEFQVSIGDARVEWLRRKDAQVVKYLAMSPEGSATRDEICRVFWPRNERPHALQNLRTTCSNIRAALRLVAPDAAVERYFDSRGNALRLIFDQTRTDLAQFNAWAVTAGDALEQGEIDVAVHALDEAHRSYRGPLVVEPVDAFYAQIAAELETRFAKIRELRVGLRRPRIA